MSSTHGNSPDNGSPNGEPLSLGAVSKTRRTVFVRVWCVLALFACLGCLYLGTWQLERRLWKLALIDRVETRVHATVGPLPIATEWSNISVDQHEYLHVEVAGRFLHKLATFVQASTVLGTGYWVIVPLEREDGQLILVNRGFVSSRDAYQPPNDTAVSHLTGLLRMSEPGGSRLRANQPEQERWFSRDVIAIGQARHLDQDRLAPFFIDADATAASPDGPIGGLTVISFYNHHLVYALTWYTLALMVIGATAYLLRQERKKHVP